MVRWEIAPYGMRGEFTDVSGLGRYLVRPEAKGSRRWRAYLNGKSTVYTGSKDECKSAVERAIRQLEIVGRS